MATDNEPSRYKLNESASRPRRRLLSVVYSHVESVERSSALRPGQSGCLACLEGLLERTKYRDGVREIDLASEEQRDKMYGLEIAEIKDSPGLNVDIAFIAAFHTSFVLDAIARGLSGTT